MNQRRCIFVVENDPTIAVVLADYLRAEGHMPRIFPDGHIVAAAVRDDPPAAMILDIGLSGMAGVKICDEVRKVSSVPILMLTGCIEEADILRGIDCRVDGYVCKPFGAREVIARLHKIIRHAEGRNGRDPSYRPWAIDEKRKRAAWAGHWLDLSSSEFKILATLMHKPGHVFKRDQLLNRLGKRSSNSDNRTIDGHIKNIRRKIAGVDVLADCVTSVYGAGYRFDGAVE